ncbi:hypothetical protein LCGC14_2645800 [marine sediment metagenome]|uniref:Helix-turn-helix domain-containing protein n=1 Tax=marine sediment metagenome TaxID=412755 RepID=A0A0F9C6Q1_9ZZZZ
MQEGKIFTLKEAADITGQSTKTLQRKVKEGKLKPVWGKKIEHFEDRELDIYMKTPEYKNRRNK